MRDHRSLKAWHSARLVVLGVLTAARASWQPWAAALFAQLQRASLSVQLNIAEGYALGRPAGFHRHLTIAYGSAVETADLLDLLRDAGLLAPDEALILLDANRTCQRLLIGLLRRERRIRDAT